MYHTNKKELTEQLDRALEKAKNAFESGIMPTISRTLKEPKKMLMRKLLVGLLKQKYRMTLKANTFYGEPYYLDNSELDIWNSGTTLSEPELYLTRYLIDTLSTSDVFFDVGAHYGFFTALASDMGAAEVHAFEASKANFSILSKNSRIRGNVRANNVAVFSVTGMVTFYDGSTQSSTATEALVEKINKKYTKVQTPSVALDDYCKEHAVWPSVIKIDIEGAEKEAIAGASELFAKHNPTVIMELLPTEYYRDNLEASNLLFAMGYKPFRIQEDGTLEALFTIVPPTANYDGHQNLVFKK